MNEKKIIKSTGLKGITITPKPQIVSQTGKVVKSKDKIDFVFVFDTTGSMSDKIHNLQVACQSLVDESSNLDIDPQFALITFGDISYQNGGDRIEVTVRPTTDTEKIKSGIANAPRNNGFGNEGESSLEAIVEAISLQFRDNTVKVMILLTDEPALQHKHNPRQIIEMLEKQHFVVFVISIDTIYYREMAEKNGGYWEYISSNTDISKILQMFKKATSKAIQTAKTIHREFGGNVDLYKQLSSGNNQGEKGNVREKLPRKRLRPLIVIKCAKIIPTTLFVFAKRLLEILI